MQKPLKNSAIRVFLLNAVYALLWLSICVLGYYLFASNNQQWDFSQNANNSLSSSSRNTVLAMDKPLTITLYSHPNPLVEQQIRTLVNRYRTVKADIDFTFHDIAIDPDTSRRLNLQAGGELILQYDGRTQRLQSLSEAKLTAAMIRLLRDKAITVGVITGHGERSVIGQANHDISLFARHIERSGFTFEPLFLAQFPKVPEHIKLLLIASPTKPYLPGEIAAIADYLQTGRNLLWLKDPETTDPLRELETLIGVHQLPGTIIDPTVKLPNVDQGGFLVFGRYSQAPAVAGFNDQVLMPQASALLTQQKPGLMFQAMMETSADSWTETGDLRQHVQFDISTSERQGILQPAIAVTRQLGKHSQQRIAVIGDGDFVANSWLGNAGNQTFGERIFNWLSGSDLDILQANTRAADTDLHLESIHIAIIGGLALILLPLTGLVLAGYFWRQKQNTRA